MSDLLPDPFEDHNDLLDQVTGTPVNLVDIRIQQRNGRKSMTIVQGLPPKLNLKKVLSYFKRNFCCNGTIVEDQVAGRVLQMTGDQRVAVANFLVEQKIVPKESIKIHGVI